MKKIKWLAYLIGLTYLIGLGLLLFLFVTGMANANVPSTYAVQSGDSLSGIAFKFYGTETVWRDIYKLNPQIGNPDLIYVGQTISLGPTIRIRSKVSRIPLPPKTYSRTEVYDKLIRHAFKVNNEEYIDRDVAEARVMYQQNFLLKHGIRELHSQRAAILVLQKGLRNLEFYHLLDGIFEACKNDSDYRMTALLTALAWQESHFNNIRGQHGEITQFQFLPSTVRSRLQLDDVGLQITLWDLLNDNRKSAKLAYEWLMENGANKSNILKALRRYNHSAGYVQGVTYKYNNIIKVIQSGQTS